MRAITHHKIYVASSWRNVWQSSVVEALRADGHLVYDFKNPTTYEGKVLGAGFSWGEIDPNWENWTPEQYKTALDSRAAIKGFDADMSALEQCSICVLVLPCGRSAHLEFAWAVGAGRLTVYYYPTDLQVPRQEPELMVKMCDYLTLTLAEVRVACSQKRGPPTWNPQRDIQYLLARGFGPSHVVKDALIESTPIKKRPLCAAYYHRGCNVCGGCWRHGGCICVDKLQDI